MCQGDRVWSLYRELPILDFSSDVLEPASRKLMVLEMKDVVWSDWGRPERILETLRVIGMEPTFCEAFALHERAT